jgi:hypothetical protein
MRRSGLVDVEPVLGIPVLRRRIRVVCHCHLSSVVSSDPPLVASHARRDGAVPRGEHGEAAEHPQPAVVVDRAAGLARVRDVGALLDSLADVGACRCSSEAQQVVEVRGDGYQDRLGLGAN